MRSDFNWIIHYVANRAICDECGKEKTTFKEFLCNVHTHGMARYGHLDFQIVIDLGEKLAGYTLNTLGRKVSEEGKKFKDGDIVEGLFENNLKIKLKEVNFEGEKLLRVIFPDKNLHYPGDQDCEYPYNMQCEEEKGIYLCKSN